MAEAAVVAANWVGQAVGATLTAAGVHASVALPVAAFAANAAYVVSVIALQAGMQYAIDAINRPKLKPPGSELQFNIDPDYPREMIIGQRLVGGSMVARYSRGSNLYNAHLVIQLADHPCVELSKVYDGGRLVRDTALTHGTRTEITAYSNSGGARVWMTWWDGRAGQAADSDLVTKSAQDPEVVAGKIEGWTSNHKGAGCAYVHVEVQWDSDILTSIPQFQFLVKGAKLYDRRKDTTAGGSGAHRLDTPSTWEYSTNAMVAMDHFLLGYTVESDPLAFGIGLSKPEVPYAQFAAAADLCDEDVVTGVGGAAETIKRYAVNGVISAGDYFEEVVEAFQLQMAARVVDLGGRIGILGAEERAVVVSLTEGDLVQGEPLQYADKLQFSDLIGSVTGTFADPANNYQPTAYAPLVSAYAALPDGGEAQATSLVFPYEVHPRRVVRLATAWLERESLQPRLAGVFMPKAWKLEPGDWFEFTSTRLQVTAAKFEVVDIVKNEDFTVLITARAIDPDFLAFDNDNDPALSVPPDVAPADLSLEAPSGTITAITISGGGATEPAIRFTLTAIPAPSREVVIEIQEWNGSALVGDPIFTTMHSDEGTKLARSGVLPNKSYKARAKTRMGRRESDWTAWSSAITTSTTYTVPGSSLASAIVGQGSGATANSVAEMNATDGANLSASIATVKRLIVNDFAADGRHWTTTFGGSPEAAADPVCDGYFDVANIGRVIRFTPTAYLQHKGLIKPVQGRRYLQVVRLRAQTDPSSGAITATLSNVNGLSSALAHGVPTFTAATPVNAIFQDTNLVVADGWITLARIWTAGAPSTYDAYVRFRLDLTQTGSGGKVEVAAFYIFDVTDVPVGRALSDLFRADGSTVLTDATVITSLGTAAAIIGQAPAATDSTIQPGATKNIVTYSASAPASPANGDVWVDTSSTPHVIKVRVAGAWQTGGTVGGTFGTDLYETGGGSLATLSNFKTILGVAASITSQGAFATLNSAAYGSALLTGFGALAAKATIDNSGLVGAGVIVYTALSSTAVRLGTNITRADGSTSLTDALAVTSLGTAAGIASQGALATLSQVNLGASGRVYRDDGTTRLTDALAVTSLGTAAAIVGQGTGATASTLAGLNATDNSKLTTALSAAKRLLQFDFSADGAAWTNAFGGSPDTVADPTADGYFDVANVGRVIRVTPANYLQPKAVIKPTPGRRYLQVVRLRAQTDPSSGAISVSISNINGLSSTWAHGAATATAATPVNAIFQDTSLVVADGWVTLARIWTAGAASTYDSYWRFRLDATQSGSGGKIEIASFEVFDVSDIPVGRALTELFRADGTTALTDASVVTSLGTASAITSQGGLATLSFVTIGTNLRLADGTTIATTALVVTASGTAAAITSQGNQATANAGSGNTASRPASTGNFSWYRNTETGFLQLDIPSVGWTNVADITSAATVAAAVAENVFTKNANVGGFTTSGTTIATLATIDANNVPASGFLKLLNAYLPVGSYTLSAGTIWDGQLIVTEQLQSGGTEHTLHTIPVQLDTAALGFTYEGGNDPGAIYPKAPSAQNVSGNSRYRLKLQRTAGTNNITASPGSGGLFQIERTPG